MITNTEVLDKKDHSFLSHYFYSHCICWGHFEDSSCFFRNVFKQQCYPRFSQNPIILCFFFSIFFIPSDMTRCKIASNLLFTHCKKFHHFIRVSVLLYIPSLPFFLLCLPPTHPAMSLLVSISVRYSFKRNSTIKISHFVRLFSMTMK